MSYLIAIAGLLGLIFVHELGHFLVAKAVGARATKFYIGFPPAILRTRRGDTEYGVGAIPLGGYVRIVGMTRPQASDLWRVIDAADEAALRRSPDEPDALAAATERLRTVLAAGRLDDARASVPAVVTALAADRELLHERTYAQAAKDLRRTGEDLDPRAYWSLAVWRRIAIIAAGPLANGLAAILIFAAFFMTGVPRFAPYVQAVVVGSPGAAAGLAAGDRVVAVGARPTPTVGDVTPAISATNGSATTITVLRDGRQVVLGPLRPRYDGGEHRYLVGFQLDPRRDGTTAYGPVPAVRHALGETWSITDGTVHAIVNLVTPKGRQGISSAAGMTQATADSVDQGDFLYLLALISLSLGIFNLLPFLPLDGGHILFSVLEKLRGGRPIPRAVYERVSVIGIALVLVLVAIGLNNDISRFTSP